MIAAVVGEECWCNYDRTTCKYKCNLDSLAMCVGSSGEFTTFTRHFCFVSSKSVVVVQRQI